MLEQALARQPPGAEMPGSVVVAGRTDAGVHAQRQVLHVDVVPMPQAQPQGRVPVDSSGVPDLDRMRHRWNRYLPPDVRVLDARVAAAGFDARFSATGRHYRYQVSDAPWGVDPLRRRDTLAWTKPLTVEAMNEACGALIGLHDFAAFCKQRAGATTVRRLTGLWVSRLEPHLVCVTVTADAFCHSMVRSLVGALLMVGDGRRDVEWPARLLHGGVRDSAVAPAHGLTLVTVDYPPAEELAERARLARNRRSMS